MAQISCFPHFFLGRGLNPATGEGFGEALDFVESEPTTTGQTILFELKQVKDSKELIEKLELSTSLSFSRGFGGLSAAFNLSKSRELNHYHTYALISVIVKNAPKILRKPTYKPEALEVLEQKGWEDFAKKFGWEYMEGVIEGGSYYGLIEIKTSSETDREAVSLKLSGHYGPLSGNGRFSRTMSEIQEKFELQVLIASSAGEGLTIETDLESMINQAKNFPKVVQHSPVPIIALTAEYAKTVLGGDSPDLAVKHMQKDNLEYLGKNYLELRDYKANLDFVLKNMEDFDDYRSLTSAEILKKKKELRKVMLAVDKETERIIDIAEKCSQDAKSCEGYTPSLSMLTLPKINGDQMTMNEMETHIKQLQEDVANLKEDSSKTLSSSQLAHNRIESLSKRIDYESVIDKPLFIQSSNGGFLSDRMSRGGAAQFQGNKEAWETMFLRRK